MIHAINYEKLKLRPKYCRSLAFWTQCTCDHATLLHAAFLHGDQEKGTDSTLYRGGNTKLHTTNVRLT